MTTPTELLALCMELNEPGFHVFLSYSGHVEPYSFSLHVCPGGYPADPIYFKHVFGDSDYSAARKWLIKQHQKYRSTQNEVDGNAD